MAARSNPTRVSDFTPHLHNEVTPLKRIADLGEFTDVVTAGDILGVSAKCVRAMIASGQLQSVRCGRLIRVPRAALEKLAEVK